MKNFNPSNYKYGRPIGIQQQMQSVDEFADDMGGSKENNFGKILGIANNLTSLLNAASLFSAGVKAITDNVGDKKRLSNNEATAGQAMADSGILNLKTYELIENKLIGIWANVEKGSYKGSDGKVYDKKDVLKILSSDNATAKLVSVGFSVEDAKTLTFAYDLEKYLNKDKDLDKSEIDGLFNLATRGAFRKFVVKNANFFPDLAKQIGISSVSNSDVGRLTPTKLDENDNFVDQVRPSHQ